MMLMMLMVLSCFLSVLVNPGVVYADNPFTKLPGPVPADLPTGWGQTVTFSGNGDFLAITHFTYPFLAVYSKIGDNFIKLNSPALIDLPTANAYGAAFSPDSKYLAVTFSAMPGIIIYTRTGSTFNRLPDPDFVPGGGAHGLAFSPDSNYLAVTYVGGSNLTIYKWNGTTFNKLNEPDIPPTKIGWAAAFSPDSNYLAVVLQDSPYLNIYSRSGDNFTRLADPADLPTGFSQGVAFSPDSNYLAVSHGVSDNLTIYKWSGITFNKLNEPDIQPTPQGVGVAFSPDSSYLATAGMFSSPYVTLYQKSGDDFTRLDDPADLPTGDGRSVAFSPDSHYLAVAYCASPYVSIYKKAATAPPAPPTQQVTSGTGTGIVTFAISNGTMTELKAVDVPAEWQWVIPYHFPHGFFSFKITDINPGATVTVTITLPSDTPTDTDYWKFSATGLRLLMPDGRLGDNDGDNILTLTLTDGNFWGGDMDGIKNGIIVDPGGPGIPEGPDNSMITALLTPGSHSSTVSITSPAQPVSLPNILVQSASLSAGSVTPGTPITVTADVTNRSTVNGSKKVTLYVNGQVETAQGITVNSGGSTKLTFNVSRSEPGDYAVYVDGVPAGSFKVELFRESDGILIFSAVLVALAFLIGMVMLWRRQQRAG